MPSPPLASCHAWRVPPRLLPPTQLASLGDAISSRSSSLARAILASSGVPSPSPPEGHHLCQMQSSPPTGCRRPPSTISMGCNPHLRQAVMSGGCHAHLLLPSRGSSCGGCNPQDPLLWPAVNSGGCHLYLQPAVMSGGCHAHLRFPFGRLLSLAGAILSSIPPLAVTFAPMSLNDPSPSSTPNNYSIFHPNYPTPHLPCPYLRSTPLQTFNSEIILFLGNKYQ